MSILRNTSCDRAAGALLGSKSALGVSAIVALTGMPEPTVVTALRTMAADGIVLRSTEPGRAKWVMNEGDPRVSPLRSLIPKIAASSDLPGGLKKVLATAKAASRAFLLEGSSGAPAHLVVVLPDLFDERWYDLVDALQATADAAGRAINIEPVSEATYAKGNHGNPAIEAAADARSVVLKGAR